MPTVKLGIAMYNMDDGMGGTFFHWAFIIHETDFRASTVDTFDISNRAANGATTGWHRRHMTTCLFNPSNRDCVGVIDLGQLPYSTTAMCSFLKDISAEKKQDDPYYTGGSSWTCASWVIRTMHDLEEAGALELSIPIQEVYQTVLHRGEQLKVMRNQLGLDAIPIINL
ncbi:uncharacterized protein STEHIDRAFT_164411 [Stereum hirsutum FP-91666 SS1]|uniref:uncharacterized protein n=1 Tax=Stereum hirsutum (strain FP-91666) TaxID=721885 RepID=UPI000440FCDC|nr:uncharacterized protein STEHIDRAFT_164411 [Stereum hirsutum FP-91666 SS1]EIM92054.1 hypothetical protein STEHIDRAFT_164411 [Stereum hirsutum FP-91666 SS1]